MPLDVRTKLLKYLYDALAAAEEIQINTIGLSEQNYFLNPTKWIVERGIEIISEALKRASAIELDLNKYLSDLPKIFATRNRIAHEYDIVDPLQLYTIAVKSVPKLIDELKAYIKNLETE